jgi:hypothetical protein
MWGGMSGGGHLQERAHVRSREAPRLNSHASPMKLICVFAVILESMDLLPLHRMDASDAPSAIVPRPRSSMSFPTAFTTEDV